MNYWKRRFLLKTIIFRFHVNLRGCIGYLDPSEKSQKPEFYNPKLGPHQGSQEKSLVTQTGNNQETAGEPRVSLPKVGSQTKHSLKLTVRTCQVAPSQKERIFFQPSVSRCYVCFRVLYVSELIHHQFHPFSGCYVC